MKIVIIGAGSVSFGRGQIADLLQAGELKGRGGTLCLVDINPQALDVMTRLAGRIKEHTGSDLVIESTTDRRAALRGADYVIIAVTRRRMELWEQDFRLPLAHGFRHCLGENGGPGALFHALRNLELIIPICRDIEELCPGALVLNFTNPEARVLHAICHLTRVRAAGICHGVFSALDLIARLLERPIGELHIVSAGMNHFYAIQTIRDRATGTDLLPEAKRRALAHPGAPPLFRKMLEVFDVFGFPSDDHIGEYLSYGAEYHGVRWPYGYESRPVAEDPAAPASPTIDDYANGAAPLDAAMLQASGEVTVPIIADIELDRDAWRPAVNVLNTEGYIENLPRHAVVEVPARVDARGIHPCPAGALPEPFAAMIRTQLTIQDLTTEAWRTRSRRLLLQTLLLDPCVNSIREAERLLDEMLVLQRAFLPEFS